MGKKVYIQFNQTKYTLSRVIFTLLTKKVDIKLVIP